jgi:hypothetical protein
VYRRKQGVLALPTDGADVYGPLVRRHVYRRNQDVQGICVSLDWCALRVELSSGD